MAQASAMGRAVFILGRSEIASFLPMRQRKFSGGSRQKRRIIQGGHGGIFFGWMKFFEKTEVILSVVQHAGVLVDAG